MANNQDITTILQSCKSQTGGVITALQNIVRLAGYIDQDSIRQVADVFNLSLAEVRGIVSFYSDLSTLPPASHRIRVCQAEACQAVGARQLTQQLSRRLNLEPGTMNDDRSVAFEPVYCLGLCANGPAAMVDGRLIAHADLDKILSAFS